jgi:hypothetical protein
MTGGCQASGTPRWPSTRLTGLTMAAGVTATIQRRGALVSGACAAMWYSPGKRALSAPTETPTGDERLAVTRPAARCRSEMKPVAIKETGAPVTPRPNLRTLRTRSRAIERFPPAGHDVLKARREAQRCRRNQSIRREVLTQRFQKFIGPNRSNKLGPTHSPTTSLVQGPPYPDFRHLLFARAVRRPHGRRLARHTVPIAGGQLRRSREYHAPPSP